MHNLKLKYLYHHATQKTTLITILKHSFVY